MRGRPGGRCARIALRAPISFVNSFGLKPSASQSLAWKGALTAKALKAAGFGRVGAAAGEGAG